MIDEGADKEAKNNVRNVIGPYSLTRVKITPKVLIISYLFANYYDQIIMC